MSFACNYLGLFDTPDEIQLHVPSEVRNPESSKMVESDKKLVFDKVDIKSNDNVMALPHVKIDLESHPDADFEFRVTVEGGRLRISSRPNDHGALLNKRFARADPMCMTKFCTFLVDDVVEEHLQGKSLQCCLLRYQESAASEYVRTLEVLQSYVNAYNNEELDKSGGDFFLCSYRNGFSLQFTVAEKKEKKKENEEDEEGEDGEGEEEEDEEEEDDDAVSHLAYFILAICDYNIMKVK